MPYHMTRRQRAKAAGSGPPLEGRTIAELEEVAAGAGVKPRRGARKKEIADAIAGAATAPAPGDTDTEGGE